MRIPISLRNQDRKAPATATIQAGPEEQTQTRDSINNTRRVRQRNLTREQMPREHLHAVNPEQNALCSAGNSPVKR